MEFNAVCSASAMTASMASCRFGSGDSTCEEACEPCLLCDRGGVSGDEVGGLPRFAGGAVGKV